MLARSRSHRSSHSPWSAAVRWGSASSQLLQPEFPDGLQHREAGGGPDLAPSDQRLVHQGRQPLQDVQAEPTRIAHDFRGLDGPAPHEGRQPGEQPPLGFVQEVVAPGDGVAQGALALGEGPDPGGEEGEAALQPRQHLLGREDLGPGGGQLDGQGQAVEPGGDLGHRRGVLLRDSEPRLHRQGPLREQPDGLEPAEGGEVGHLLGVGGLEGRHQILLLAAQPQHDPGGGHHLQPGGRDEELLDHGARLHHLFEVIDHQEELSVPEVVLHAVEDGASGHLRDPQGAGHRGGNQGRIGHRGQVHEEAAVLVVGEDLPGHLQRQPGLPGPPGAGQGEQPGPAQEVPDFLDLLLPPHERGELGGKVVRPGAERAGRGELRGQPVDDQVVEALGADQVLEPMLPQVPERHPFGEPPLHQGPGGVRHDDLPPVGRPGDAGSAVDVDAHVVAPARGALARVQPDADPKGIALGPGVSSQRPLDLDRGPDSPRRAGEHHEEGVPLRADLHAAAMGDGSANDRVVLLLHRRVSLPQLLEQPGGALDVREQERDRPSGQLCHGRAAI